ncbi:hypothetical protein V2J09_018855 [Rumex salicifolius]
MSISVSSSSSSSCSSIISHHPTYRSVPLPRLHSRRDQPQMLFTRKTTGHALRIYNVYSAREEARKEVIMVDPVEAKRLAAKEMEQIRAKEKFKRRRKIEAINGAWAMIGLTAGLIIEGQTGKSIIDQLLGYIQAIMDFFPW